MTQDSSGFSKKTATFLKNIMYTENQRIQKGDQAQSQKQSEAITRRMLEHLQEKG